MKTQDLQIDLETLLAPISEQSPAGSSLRYEGTYDKIREARREEAESIGVTGIPTFVIGNQGMVGCQPYEVLREFVVANGAKPRA